MPWIGTPPNQTYQRSDSVRSGTDVYQQQESAGIDIVALWHDNTEQDMASALNLVLKRDGGNRPTTDIDWGGFKIENLSVGTADDDSVTLGQASRQGNAYVVGAGAADAYTAAPTPAWTAYTAGDFIRVDIGTANTGAAATLAVSGLAAIGIKTRDGGNPVAGALLNVCEFVYDGTNFIHMNGAGIIQRVFGSSNTYDNTASNIPFIDSIPTNVQGKIAVQKSITVQRADSRLRIEAHVNIAGETANVAATITLRFDSDTLCTAVEWATTGSVSNASQDVELIHDMASPGVGATNVIINYGVSTGNAFTNGISTGRVFGGIAANTLTIEEYL